MAQVTRQPNFFRRARVSLAAVGALVLGGSAVAAVGTAQPAYAGTYEDGIPTTTINDLEMGCDEFLAYADRNNIDLNTPEGWQQGVQILLTQDGNQERAINFLKDCGHPPVHPTTTVTYPETTLPPETTSTVAPTTTEAPTTTTTAPVDPCPALDQLLEDNGFDVDVRNDIHYISDEAYEFLENHLKEQGYNKHQIKNILEDQCGFCIEIECPPEITEYYKSRENADNAYWDTRYWLIVDKGYSEEKADKLLEKCGLCPPTPTTTTTIPETTTTTSTIPETTTTTSTIPETTTTTSTVPETTTSSTTSTTVAPPTTVTVPNTVVVVATPAEPTDSKLAYTGGIIGLVEGVSLLGAGVGFVGAGAAYGALRNKVSFGGTKVQDTPAGAEPPKNPLDANTPDIENALHPQVDPSLRDVNGAIVMESAAARNASRNGAILENHFADGERAFSMGPRVFEAPAAPKAPVNPFKNFVVSTKPIDPNAVNPFVPKMGRGPVSR